MCVCVIPDLNKKRAREFKKIFFKKIERLKNSLTFILGQFCNTLHM